MIPDSAIQQVIEATDLVALVNEYVAAPGLRKSGAQMVAKCCFHDERTASLYVHPAKQFYHCKGCGAGGNAINFIIQAERLSFPEAVRRLAIRAGIELDRVSPADIARHNYARQLAREAEWFYRSQGIQVDDSKIALKKYYEYRLANPNLTVRQFRDEQAFAAAEKEFWAKVEAMVPDMFEEDFDEMIDIICRPREEERSPVLESEFDPYMPRVSPGALPPSSETEKPRTRR